MKYRDTELQYYCSIDTTMYTVFLFLYMTFELHLWLIPSYSRVPF